MLCTTLGRGKAADPVTALLPFALLGLWHTFAVTLLNLLVWLGIYTYRAPDNEDWLGRKDNL